MEQFDAIDSSQDAFMVQPGDAYVSVPRQWGYEGEEMVHSRGGSRILRNSNRLYIYGGVACAAIVFIVVVSSSSNKQRSSAQGSSIYNGGKGPVLLNGRHPPQGNYHDSIELYVREDISALSSSYTQDTEMTTLIESDKHVKDLQDDQKQWDITTTRLATDTEMLGQTSKCDTDDRRAGDPVACAALFAAADTKMSFVIDADGTVVSETDTDAHGHMTKHSRSSAGGPSPVESVDNALKYLPDHQVSVGEDWHSDIELSSVGSYTGRTTFVGYTKCGNNHKAECAVLESTGKVFMDVKAMSEKFASLSIDPSMMNVVDGTISQTIHWDNEHGYFPFTQTYLNFTMEFSFPMQKKAIIPVKERITAKTSLVER